SLFNWPAAHPLYEHAEEIFERTGDHRNAAYARIGRLRAEFGTCSYEEIARDLERELQTPVVDGDPRLKLWGSRQRATRTSRSTLQPQARLGAGADSGPATVGQEMD